MTGALGILPGILEFLVWLAVVFVSLTLFRRSKAAMVLVLLAASCFFLRVGNAVLGLIAVGFLTWAWDGPGLFALFFLTSSVLTSLQFALLVAAVFVGRQVPALPEPRAGA